MTLQHIASSPSGLHISVAAWEAIGTLGAFIIAALVYVHLVTARPKVRCFVTKPHQRGWDEWHVLGYLLYVNNLGRSPAILLSAGLAQGEGCTYSGELPKALDAFGPSALFPLVLRPGEIAQVFISADSVGDEATARFGAHERRWRRGRWREIYHVAPMRNEPPAVTEPAESS